MSNYYSKLFPHHLLLLPGKLLLAQFLFRWLLFRTLNNKVFLLSQYYFNVAW